MAKDQDWLYTSRGEPIALEWQGQLYSRAGIYVGHYLPAHGILVDRYGRYLGELACEDRLVVNQASPHRAAHFGLSSPFGAVGPTGLTGSVGPVTLRGGYADVDPARPDQPALA